MDGAFGYNLPGNMGPLLGTIFVKKLIERSVARVGYHGACRFIPFSLQVLRLDRECIRRLFGIRSRHND